MRNEVFLIIAVFMNVLTEGVGNLELEPIFNVTSLNVTVVAGQKAILPCSVELRNKYQVVWVNHRNIVVSLGNRRLIDDRRISIERPFMKEWNLHIRNVSDLDTGTYKCQINTKPIRMKHIYLKVLVPSKIVDYLSSEDLITREGETVTLVCNVTGIPQPNVTWYRKRIHERVETKERIGVEGEVLIIHNTSRYCDDIYECIAHNGVPPSVNRQIRVSVEFSPEVRLPETRMGQSRHKETILECEVNAFPLEVGMWEKSGRQITNSWKYRLDVYNREQNRITLSLRIRDIQKEDYGEYSCVASNRLGNDRETMILYEYIPQPTTRKTTTTTQLPTREPTKYHHPYKPATQRTYPIFIHSARTTSGPRQTSKPTINGKVTDHYIQNNPGKSVDIPNTTTKQISTGKYSTGVEHKPNVQATSDKKSFSLGPFGTKFAASGSGNRPLTSWLLIFFLALTVQIPLCVR